MLKSENFEYRELVDIFDGGPVMHAETSKIRAIRESQVLPVVGVKDLVDGKEMLISNCELEFRVCLGNVSIDDTGATIDRVTALELGLKVGMDLRCVSLRASK